MDRETLLKILPPDAPHPSVRREISWKSTVPERLAASPFVHRPGSGGSWRDLGYCARTTMSLTSYREHGHATAQRECRPSQSWLSCMAKPTGCSKGKGGSMHMFDKECELPRRTRYRRWSDPAGDGHRFRRRSTKAPIRSRSVSLVKQRSTREHSTSR